MAQPKWKLLWSTDYSAVFTDETDVYPPEMMIAQEHEERGKTKFAVFRFPLGKLKKVDGFVVPEAWEPTWPHPLKDYEEWFMGDLAKVASFVGATKKELVEALTSEDVHKRAWAYESIGAYHGYANFDEYPQIWSAKKMDKHWP